jgi:LAS superfamily LD-carboxypeptidase LdcB
MPLSAARALLVGQTEAHLCSPADVEHFGARLHVDVAAAFIELRSTAWAAGFELAVLSGFRSFEQQLSIWNRKATGALVVLDNHARPLDIASLSEEELVFSILRWSALPGASRHHWGTDLDVYDLAAKPEGYEVELMPEEVNPGGMFGPFHEWLDARIASGRAFGFYRPYDIDRRGVAPERWHVSYAPLSSLYARMLTPDVLREVIEPADMRLKDVVLGRLPVIFDRFVANTNPAYA